MKKKIPAILPARTREHHIADLSRNYVERLVLLQGWTVEVKQHDYGYDLVLNTYDYQGDSTYQWGEIESGDILLQLKATDNLTTLKDGQTISFTVSSKHIRLWSEERMPVILVIYDVVQEQAYWLYTQQYFNSSTFKMKPTQQNVTLHIPKRNIVDGNAIRQFREFKQKVLGRVKKENLHE